MHGESRNSSDHLLTFNEINEIAKRKLVGFAIIQYCIEQAINLNWMLMFQKTSPHFHSTA